MLLRDIQKRDVGLYLVSAYELVGNADDQVWNEYFDSLDSCIARKPRNGILKVCVKINDAIYSFVYYFFVIASIFSIFGMLTETVFVHPRKQKKSKKNIFCFRKRGVKVLQLLEFSFFFRKKSQDVINRLLKLGKNIGLPPHIVLICSYNATN